jgi:hypothetical protein
MFHIDLCSCETRGVGGARRCCQMLADPQPSCDIWNMSAHVNIPQHKIPFSSHRFVFVCDDIRLSAPPTSMFCMHSSAYHSISQHTIFPKCDKTECSQSLSLSEACFLCNCGINPWGKTSPN